jgi:predicted CoA-substrate-specific enzyme activase
MRSAGIDIGSRAIKLVLCEHGRVVERSVEDTGSDPLAVCRRLLDGLAVDRITGTGHGRHLFKEHWPAAEVMTEIKAVAAGAAALVPGCLTIVDIGGQDSKAIALDAAVRVQKFVMNDRCAAGTGQFLGLMATALAYTRAEFIAAARRAPRAQRLSSMCSVFAQSEVVSLIARGAAKEEMALGVHEAIARRTERAGGERAERASLPPQREGEPRRERRAGRHVGDGEEVARHRAVEPRGEVVLPLAPPRVEEVLDVEADLDRPPAVGRHEVQHGLGRAGGAVGQRTRREEEAVEARAPARRVHRRGTEGDEQPRRSGHRRTGRHESGVDPRSLGMEVEPRQGAAAQEELAPQSPRGIHRQHRARYVVEHGLVAHEGREPAEGRGEGRAEVEAQAGLHRVRGGDPGGATTVRAIHVGGVTHNRSELR